MALSANPVAAEIARAVAAVLGISPDDVKIDPPPRPELGDFAVPAFPLAKLTKEPPPAVAARVARDLPRSGVVTDVTATGPFINVKVDRAAALRVVLASVADAATLIPARGAGQTVCIDYSSPNISKHLAYHHIRSTMLGHALASIHEALGYTVVGINHLGDWGTTHGMLLSLIHI